MPTYHYTRPERQELEAREKPVRLDRKVAVWGLYPPRRGRLPDYFRELLTSGVSAEVLEQAIAEYQVVLAEAARTRVCLQTFIQGSAGSSA